jgi:hypothetical protein
METPTASSRIPAFIILYDIHSGLYQNVLEGISDEDAQNRLNTKANHVAWIAGSLLQERFEMAKLLSADPGAFTDQQAAHELFRDHQGIQDHVTYPSLESYKKDWNRITPVLRDALANVTEDKLNEKFDMGEEKMTVFDLVTFLAHREAYCIGQIALYRRLLGYEAMKYSF